MCSSDLGAAVMARLLKTPASSFATVFVIAVGLLLPALLYGVSTNLSSVVDNLNGSAQISLFMVRGSTASELQQVSEYLLSDDAISGVVRISSEQALEEYSAATGLSEISQQLSDNPLPATLDRKSTRLNSSHKPISYAVFCLEKKKKKKHTYQ
mgnify:CR=1 FL=1